MDPATTSRTGPDHLPTAAALAAVAALSDELRRRMYGFIRRARRPVSREEAAKSVGISRKLAAFHLDKLVEVGLLRARYEPVGGIRKVGRTPKVYEPTDDQVRISIPAREHDLLADILIDALLTEDQGKAGREAALQVARHRG
ncbi:MAG: helix-turn-helix domain-containing protein, partial [Pseudonocardiaceae bacterium]